MITQSIICLAFSIFLPILINGQDNSVIANTFYGKVEGKLVTLTDGAKFHVFLGIPYAKPPIGDLRFAIQILLRNREVDNPNSITFKPGLKLAVASPPYKPLPPDHWDGIRDAKTFFTWCIQDTESNVHSDPNTKEDCLYLNVFTPDTASHEVGFQNGYPVMFWVHGGGFYTGSSVEYPTQGILDYLVRRNVIVVTINYRLWTLGFLSTGDDAAPGNWGLWDQTRALEWVQGNIRFFGGDPHKVTIFGESAGAAATSALSLSPQSNGLFQQVISQSGSVFDSFGSHNKTFTAKYTKELAMAAYCPEAPSRSLIDCLRSKNVTQLKIAAKKMGGSKLAFTFEGFKFGPVQDGYFFPDTMQNLAAKAPKKPTIMGVNSLEAALYEYLLGKSQKELINDPNFGVDYLMGKLEIPLYQFYLNDRQKAEFKAVIQQVYFENDKQNKTMLIYNYFKLSSDIIFDKGAYEEAKYKSTAGSPVWMYVFDFYNDNMFPQGTIVKGAYHAMELAYLFATDTMIPHVTSLDRLVASHLQTMWTNFAIYGCPTTGQWQRFSEARPQYLDIKPILQMKPVFNPKMIKVFEDILPKIKQ